jgi:hypothetical protein
MGQGVCTWVHASCSGASLSSYTKQQYLFSNEKSDEIPAQQFA